MHRNNSTNLFPGQKCVPSYASANPAIQHRPVRHGIVAAENLPHAVGSGGLVALGNALMATLRSHSSGVRIPNMRKSQTADNPQNFPHGLEALRVAAAYDAIDDFAFAHLISSVLLLAVSFQASEDIIETVLGAFNLVTVFRPKFFVFVR